MGSDPGEEVGGQKNYLKDPHEKHFAFQAELIQTSDCRFQA